MENWPILLALLFFTLWMRSAFRYEQQRRKAFEDAFVIFLETYPFDHDLADDEGMKRRLYHRFKQHTKHL